MQNSWKYCLSRYSLTRLPSAEVAIGSVPMGGGQPIRIQSMTTTDTMDTEGTVQQTLRMVRSGCEYVRITAPSIKHAENLANIQKKLRAQGCDVPLIADIHFTPNAAEVAARIVSKVRVNPGNYADKKKFEQVEYSDSEYQSELQRIYERFSPLVKICKEYGTAMRVGTNHGSLSDRIMSRYGDTPLGMVESAMEFVRICEDLGYKQLVLSMKASNTQVMVQAYRLLMQRMIAAGTIYPVHLGVTEAGEGQDGRVKSAIGIASLLADGIGDTVRVSLTEDPEFEAPVAKYLIDYVEDAWQKSENHNQASEPCAEPKQNPFQFARRSNQPAGNIGQSFVPRVIADCSDGQLELSCPDLDYAYLGKHHQLLETLPASLKGIVDAKAAEGLDCAYWYSSWKEFWQSSSKSPNINFVQVSLDDCALLAKHPLQDNTVLVLCPQDIQSPWSWRSLLEQIGELAYPLIVQTRSSQDCHQENYRMDLASQLGVLLIDGLIDGLYCESNKDSIQAAFALLQASRLRTTKTEYISCPSCGRTLFDLQQTTANIRQRTEHLKDVKIGIMGCIVNGPGEMADADYGYVGSGPGKITLYRGQEVVKKNVPMQEAVDRLIELIQEDGRWQDSHDQCSSEQLVHL